MGALGNVKISQRRQPAQCQKPKLFALRQHPFLKGRRGAHIKARQELTLVEGQGLRHRPEVKRGRRRNLAEGGERCRKAFHIQPISGLAIKGDHLPVNAQIVAQQRAQARQHTPQIVFCIGFGHFRPEEARQRAPCIGLLVDGKVEE